VAPYAVPPIRLAQQRGTLASGQLLADLAANEPLWSAIDRIVPKMGKSEETRARYAVSAASLKRKANEWLGDEAKVGDLQFVDWSTLHAQWATSGSDWNRLRSFLSAFCTKLFNNKRHPFRGEMLDKIDRAEEVERSAAFSVDEFWGVVVERRDICTASMCDARGYGDAVGRIRALYPGLPSDWEQDHRPRAAGFRQPEEEGPHDSRGRVAVAVGIAGRALPDHLSARSQAMDESMRRRGARSLRA